MTANIPGATNAIPGVFTDTITVSNGVNVPGGLRVAAIIGEGSANETIVSSAQGGGLDGLNPTYTSTTGADGRHFQLQNFPLVENRTTIFKNGIPLVGFEGVITPTTTFPNNFQYELDITNGELLLQGAYLEDQGGTFYVPLSTNVGQGVLNNLTLVDQDAPPEIWTVRCIAVQRNPLNQPIPGTATFIAIGSISGSLLDANGNPIVWIANNETVSNGILSFSIQETTSGGVTISPFVQGDAFTIIVESGVLVAGDSLTSTEIPVVNLNVPTLVTGMGPVITMFGVPSTPSTGSSSNGNNLSMGCQLAFSNNAPSILALQAAPPLPRRTSYILDPSVNALSTNDNDFIFPFPIGVVPDFNSDIHFFVQNNTTLVETQILPNKFTYYLLDTAGEPTTNTFINSNSLPPAGYSYSYTVIQSFEEVDTGFDGYLGRLPAFGTQAVFSSASVTFESTNVGQLLQIIDSNNKANVGIFNITAVSNGQLTIQTITTGEPGDPIPYESPSGFPDFVSQTPATFELIYIPTGLPAVGGAGTDGTLVAFLNTATATLTSTAVNFGNFQALAQDYRLQINGSLVGNDGLYDIIGYNSGTNTITLQMAFVSESNLRYEVLDPLLQSNYLVVNRNIVPNGNQLRVTIVDARDASFYDAGWINALAALEIVQCDIVVPLPAQTISVIFQNALAHCIAMSSILNRKERVLFIGAISGLTPDNLAGLSLAAVEDIGPFEGIDGETITNVLSGNIEDLANYSVPDAYGNTFRCVYFYPDQILVQQGANNVLIDGFYLAAAAAGYEVADTIIQNPLTNKTLTGFTILGNRQFSTATLQQLAASGVTTLQPVAGGGNVVWGITTSQSGFVEEQEISIVFIRDRVAKTLRAGFQPFIGNPQTPDTSTVLNTRAVIILTALISQGIISAYTGLSVQQDPVNPTQWDITVAVQPTYPVNFIYIKISLGQISATTSSS
jgi:hypothetical protein